MVFDGNSSDESDDGDDDDDNGGKEEDDDYHIAISATDADKLSVVICISLLQLLSAS